MKNTQLFLDIISGKVPCEKVYENEQVFAFLDIHPVNKGHVLVVPKTYAENLLDTSDDSLAAIMAACKTIAKAIMASTGATGFNIIQNNGSAAGQVIFHTHFHVIPRFDNDGFKHWHGQPYDGQEMADIAVALRHSIVSV